MDGFYYAKELYQEIERFRRAGHTIKETESFFRKDYPHYFPKKTNLIAVISQKGGTGKSTKAINLAFGLASTGIYRVGLVDLDIEDPNDAEMLSTELEYLADGRGDLSSILTGTKRGITEEERNEMIKKGKIADFLYKNMATTRDPKIYALFSDLLSKVDKNQVYQEVFSLFTKASTYKSKMDFLVCDFASGSMSDSKVAELMKYFDYRLLVVVPNNVGIAGIKTAIANDFNGEFQRENAENILVLNRVKPGFLENIPGILSTKGRGTYEAEAFLDEVRRDLSQVLRVDYGVVILYNDKVDQDLSPTETLRPAIIRRKPVDYCREINKITNFIINSTITKRKKSGGRK